MSLAVDISTETLAPLPSTRRAPSPWRSSAAMLAIVLIIVLITAFRLYQCTRLPLITGDIVRHILYGLLTNRHGLALAGQPLAEINYAFRGVSWSGVPYNYPALTLLFFRLIGMIWPTMLLAKVSLTAIEALNAWLIYRFSGRKWLGVIYWASPLSIWWVSREAQFEPLQTLFVLLALNLLAARRIGWASVALALGVQVKLSAILLLPYVLVTQLRSGRIRIVPAFLLFVAGFAPTLLMQQAYPAMAHVLLFSSPLSYNPYYWNPFNRALWGDHPPWLIMLNQMASGGFVLGLAAKLARPAERLALWAPLGFLLAIKLHTNVQPWYLLFFLPFVLPIRNERLRFWLFALHPLLDIYATLNLFGYCHGNPLPAHYWNHLTVLSSLRVWIH